MKVFDSSIWLAFFKGEPSAKQFFEVLENKDDIIVPTIVIFEVYKKLWKSFSKEAAIEAFAYLKMCQVREMSDAIGILAAYHGIKYQLPMADSIVFATARCFEAEFWTMDSDFAHIEGVKYFSRK